MHPVSQSIGVPSIGIPVLSKGTRLKRPWGVPNFDSNANPSQRDHLFKTSGDLSLGRKGWTASRMDCLSERNGLDSLTQHEPFLAPREFHDFCR